MKKLILCAIMLVLISPASAQNSEFPVKLYVNGRNEFSRIFTIVEYVEDFSPKTGMVKAYVTDDSYTRLILEGFTPQILVDTSAINMAYSRMHPDETMYHDNTQLGTWARGLAAAYPTIVSIDSFGPTVQNRWIWVVRITDNPHIQENEPEFIFASTLHGDEPVGTEFIVWLCDSLTQKYATSARHRRIVDSLDLWLIPMLNPDGNALSRRTNANSVDLNRNFPVPDGSIGADGTYTRQTETQRIIEYYSKLNPVMSIVFHGGTLCVNYPWDFDAKRAPDDLLYIKRSLDYARLNTPMYTSSEFDSGITNGYDWYEADGSAQDWDYQSRNGLTLTIEISNIKWPSDGNLPALWANNYAAMMRQMELGLTGLHGVVVDSVTGLPVRAHVWIHQIRRWVRTDTVAGDFHRELLAGTYTITVIPDGHYPKTITGIVMPTDTSSVRLTIFVSRAETLFTNNFETSSAPFTFPVYSSHHDWEWGTPTLGNTTPEYVPSGTKLLATELSGDYSDSSKSRAVLPVDLSSVTSAALVFDNWYRFQAVTWTSSPVVAHDGGNIKIATATDTVIISPPWGYDLTASVWNLMIPSGDSMFADDVQGTPWQKFYTSLDDFCGQSINILFDFGSSTSTHEDGWYIDNVVVVAPNTTVGINENSVAQKPTRNTIKIFPNPFNSVCEIYFGNAFDKIEKTLSICDINGRIVFEHKFTCSDKITWNTNSLPSGVYMVRVHANGFIIESARAILLK